MTGRLMSGNLTKKGMRDLMHRFLLGIYLPEILQYLLEKLWYRKLCPALHKPDEVLPPFFYFLDDPFLVKVVESRAHR